METLINLQLLQSIKFSVIFDFIGPPGIPIYGNLRQMGSQPLKVIQEWKEKYGDVVGLQLGQYR